MHNRIRKFLLLAAGGLALAGGYFLFTKFPQSKVPVSLRFTDEGVNLVIENFKITHEESGHNDWELKAESAKVNQKKNITRLQNVRIKVDLKNNQRYWISADSGVLQNETQDFDLEGNVKFTADPDYMVQRIPKLKAKDGNSTENSNDSTGAVDLEE